MGFIRRTQRTARVIAGTALVNLNVRVALVGGAVGRAAFGTPLSIAAAVGFIACVGQAPLDGVLEMQRPMAVVIAGGTVSAALLRLVVLPVVYRLAMPMFIRIRPVDPGPSMAPPDIVRGEQQPASSCFAVTQLASR